MPNPLEKNEIKYMKPVNKEDIAKERKLSHLS